MPHTGFEDRGRRQPTTRFRKENYVEAGGLSSSACANCTLQWGFIGRAPGLHSTDLLLLEPPLRTIASPSARFGITLLLATACSPGTEQSGGAPAEGGSTGSFVGPGGGGAGQGGSPCEGTTYAAEYKPLNLYIMVDASSSMAGSKWEAARAGLETFLTDNTITDVDVAINFFPRPAGGPPACDQMAYKEPVVQFGPLPGNGPAILAAMDARQPDGFNSPMFPALGGAILKGIDLTVQNPDEVAAVLLVTDGKPDGPGTVCAGQDPSDPSVVAALAASGLAFSPSVRTLVVGLPGVDVAIADQIAAAGGSEKAIVVGTSDTANSFAAALKKAQGAAVGCVFKLPTDLENGTVDSGDVNVSLTPGGGNATVVLSNPDCSGGEGWAFDDEADPKSIVLCEGTCAAVESDDAASVNIVLGCPTAF